MEPVTHMLTGAVLARVGFNRKAAYATAAMAIAAEFPDIDITWGFLGPLTGFLHHRGITHTFVALPFEAAAIVGGFWFAHRLRKRPTKAPVSWMVLFFGCWLALGSHILLDWTNNYGVRPFFPFNPRWYAGSFVFIFEPVMFLPLLGAFVMPALFGLIGSEVGARKPAFRGRGWAIAALVGIGLLYAFRYVQRAQAIDVAAQNGAGDATRMFASPYPVNPFLWHVVSDRPDSYLLSQVDSRRRLVLSGDPSDTIYKPEISLPILVAKRTQLGKVYLDWSMYPVITQTPDNDDPNHPLTQVTFADARFMYDVSYMKGRTQPPISGSVLLDMAAREGDRVVETRMNGKLQK